MNRRLFNRNGLMPFHRAAAACAALTLIAVPGCTGPPPAVAPGGSIASALDFQQAVAFRTEGGPLNEGTADVATLMLADAMQRAVITDPSIQAAMARVRIALADAQQARLWPNPILNLALRWPESGGTPIVEASLAQDFIAILMVPRKAGAADHRLRQAAAEAVTVALDVAAELQERYATVQALDELIPVLQKQHEQLDRLVKLADARLQVGEGTRQDLTVLEAQRMELSVEIASTEQEQRDERLRLARRIGEPSSAANWTLEPWTSPQASAAPEAAWVDAGLINRPEIQAVGWQLAALGDDLALTSLIPFEGTSAGIEAERDGDWSVGPSASVPVPVFDMGQLRKAKVTAEQIEARHELTQARRMVVEDVRRAHESLARSETNLQRVRTELIPLQQQRRSHAEALFRAGEDVTGLFLAEQDLRAAEAKAVDLERQTTLAQVRLHRAVGGAGVARQITAPAISLTTDSTAALGGLQENR